MEKQKTRNEIDEKYKWDLTRIYKNDESWYKDYEEFNKLIEEITKYQNNLFSSASILKEYLLLEEKLDKLQNKLGGYAHLKETEDKTNVTYQKLLSLLTDAEIKLNSYESFFDEAYFNEDFDKIMTYLESDEYLKSYKTVFERKNRYREHFLPKEKEKLLNILLKPMYQPGNIYSMLTDSELKFGTIKDEFKKDVELTESNYSIYIKSKDRKVRESAFKRLYEVYSNFKNTITLCYTGDIDATIALNKAYNFADSRYAALYNDNINLSVYDNLILSVHNNLEYLYKYYAIKKKILKLDEIHLYDMYTKVYEKSTTNYSYEQAKKIVLDALSPLGEEYLKKAKTIFDNRLVDVYNNVGKRGGAFSSGSYDTDPYILLNYEGKFGDVSTLAHELGHSMHTMYSKENNLRQYADYKIFVAEVASTVNELLLAKYMLDKSSNKLEKLSIINESLDSIKATIYRQTMFAEFEMNIYKMKEEGKPLTNDIICDYYYELNKKYFGNNVVVDEEIKYEWERIPHFYTPFYVYKYATSMSASIYIADKIYNGDTEFRDKYLEFLKLGSKMDPIDELKTLGIDMEKESVVADALNSFSNLVNLFEKLSNEYEGSEVNG